MIRRWTSLALFILAGCRCASTKTDPPSQTEQSARCTLPDGGCVTACRVDSERYDRTRGCWLPVEALACSDSLYEASCNGPFCWIRDDNGELRRYRCRLPVVPKDGWRICTVEEAKLMDEKSSCP